MRNILFLSVFSMLVFTATVDAAPQEPAKVGAENIKTRIRPMTPPPGHRNGPRDMVFFGLSRKGEEMKPFLLNIQPLPPREPASREEPARQEKPQPSPGKEPGMNPMPVTQRGFLGIDGQGHLLTNVQISFIDAREEPKGPPPLKSIKAAILDITPPIIDPAEMEKMTEEERRESAERSEESLKTAKEIGTLELNFAMHSDLKSPLMTDMQIMTAEGHATINGEEFALFFVSPPPPPHPEHPEGQPGQRDDNPPPSPEEGQH